MVTNANPQTSTIDRLTRLERDVWQIKIGIGAVLAVFVAMGFAGAVGWNSLTGASTSLATMTQQIAQQKVALDGNKDDIKRVTDAAVRDALKANDTVPHLERIDKRLDEVGKSGSVENSNVVQALGNGHAVEAACKPGYAVTAVRLNLGGTCNNKCDGDGRPVSSYQVICAKL